MGAIALHFNDTETKEHLPYDKTPDLRGRFVRGVDSGAGQDPDAAKRTASALGGNTGDRVGSFQGGSI